MRIPLKMSTGKRYLPWLPGYVSSLLVFVFLFASIGSIGAGVFLWPSAAEAQGSQESILHRHHSLIREAIEVQHRHLGSLMRIPDVVGTGVGIGLDRLPAIKVFTTRPGVPGIPEWLESTPVQVEVTGMVVALQTDPTDWFPRPVPIGVSTGHPAITAGTIGTRVKDGAGNFYALSNNHVYANQNDANSIVNNGFGDSALQPGPYDGGSDTEYYQIGTLYDFEPIDFSLSGENDMDAAIAKILDPVDDFVSNSTLSDGYGTPNSAIFGDSNGDVRFDDINALLELRVQKYGRTTGFTRGTVDAINVYVQVCYKQWWIFCRKSAYFSNQIQISPAGFSGGGDSGSLIVTDDANKNPVGLLFAGSDTTTFANRIDLVLSRFGVTIDDGTGTTPVPPAEPSNLTATAISATQIDLTWIDHATNEDGFKIERCTGSGNFAQIATVGANVTSYSDKGLSASTTYRYRVSAYNAPGASGFSNEADATTPAAPVVPAAPTNLKATAVSRSQINLSWTDNSNNENGFKIERCRGEGCTNFAQIATVGPNVTTYSNTGLIWRVTYRYRVRAYNAAGSSAYSNITSAKTLW